MKHCYVSIRSLSARRAWIEIVNTADKEARKRLSLSARRAWIEIQISVSTVVGVLSLSARRAWIEIQSNVWAVLSAVVALRKESVDRNLT